MQQEAEKYGVRQVVSNNLFLLKQIGKVSPWRIPAIMIDAVADWSKGLIFRDTGIRIYLEDFSRGWTFVSSFLCVPSGEYSFEELLFSPVRSENSVLFSEADVWQGTGGRPGML